MGIIVGKIERSSKMKVKFMTNPVGELPRGAVSLTDSIEMSTVPNAGDEVAIRGKAYKVIWTRYVVYGAQENVSVDVYLGEVDR